MINKKMTFWSHTLDPEIFKQVRLDDLVEACASCGKGPIPMMQTHVLDIGGLVYIVCDKEGCRTFDL